MAVFTGLQWLVAIETVFPASAVPPAGGDASYDDLPNQTGGDMNQARESVNANHKGNAGWGDSLTTSRNLSITYTGWTDPNNVVAGGPSDAYNYLVDQILFSANTDEPVNIELTNEDGDTIVMHASVGDFTESFPQDGIVEYTVTFNSRGTVAAPTRV